MENKIIYYTGTLASGGAERQLIYTALAAKGRGYEVKIVIDYPVCHYNEMLSGSGIKVECTHSTRYSPLKRYFALSDAIRSFKPQIMHSFLATKNLWGMALARRWEVPVKIASVRNTSDKEFTGIRLYQHCADKIICNTKMAAEIAEKRYGVPSEKLMVVYNAIDTTLFREAIPAPEIRETSGLRKGTKLGVTVARFAHQKNHTGLLQALKMIADEGLLDDLHYILVGSTENITIFENVRNEIETLGLTEKVSILGVREDIPEILKSCDFMVLPSFYEGFPNVVLEAMAAGVFVIATPVGGTPELVEDGENGLLTSGTEPLDLADGLRKYLSMDKMARERILDAASKHVMSFDKGKAFEAIFSLYESCGI